MGELYLAEDTKLNRKVTPKILPDDLQAIKKLLLKSTYVSSYIMASQLKSALHKRQSITKDPP